MVQLLRRSPRLRAVVYLSLMAGLAEAVNAATYNSEDPNSSIHYRLFPITMAVTYLFASLDERDAAAWRTLPSADDLRKLGEGALFGGGAIMAFLGLAAACGWASAPRWGWETSDSIEVWKSVALSAIQNGVTVWDEEMVFHGYGFDTLRGAFGRSAALVVSTVLFALYHGIGVRRLMALSLLGGIFLALRLESGSLWLPIGFHWAWNMGQNALFGNPEVAPSVRPLQVHGPEEWIGRPGALQPGWLVIIYLAALLAVLVVRRQRAAAKAEKPPR